MKAEIWREINIYIKENNRPFSIKEICEYTGETLWSVTQAFRLLKKDGKIDQASRRGRYKVISNKK